MKRATDKKKSKQHLHEQVPQFGQEQQNRSEFSTVDIPLVHFSPSGRIRLQKQKKPSNLHQKSWKSENSLVALFVPEEKSSSSSGSSKPHDTKHLSVPSQSHHTFGRRRSVSLNSIPLALLSTMSPSTSTVKYVPAIVTHTEKGDLELDHQLPCGSTASLHAANINLNVSSLKSYKSIEMLSGEDIKEMVSNLQEDNIPSMKESTKKASSHPDEIAPDFPTVPKRRSAFLKNCMVTDNYLIQQGKRLSGLPLDCSILDEKRQSKSFFTKVSDVLKKVGSSNSLTSSDNITEHERRSCATPPHFVVRQKNSGSVQDLRSLQLGTTQQGVVPRPKMISKIRLATRSCTDMDKI